MEEWKVTVLKHRSSGNWTLHVQVPVDDSTIATPVAVLLSESKIQILHLPSLEAAG